MGNLDKCFFEANDTCVEFADTYWGFKNNEEYRPDLREFLDFFLHIGVIDAAQRRELGEIDEAAGRAFLKRAFALRKILISIFTALCSGASPEAIDIEAFNDALMKNRALIGLRWERSGFSQSSQNEKDPFCVVFHPILEAASSLLLSGAWKKLKRCVECGYFFLDTSRNGLRRYCAMERSCGSWAKARRHSAKAKKPADM